MSGLVRAGGVTRRALLQQKDKAIAQGDGLFDRPALPPRWGRNPDQGKAS